MAFRDTKMEKFHEMETIRNCTAELGQGDVAAMLCLPLFGARASWPDLRENQILMGFSPEQPQLSTD